MKGVSHPALGETEDDLTNLRMYARESETAASTDRVEDSPGRPAGRTLLSLSESLPRRTMQMSEKDALLRDDGGDRSDGSSTVHPVKIPDDEEEEQQERFSFRKLWAFTGPGFLMSIAYLDPGNIESDLQAGAVAGYSLLWVLLLATVAGYVLQVLAARLGVVTGKHLAEVCYDNYSRGTRIFLWVMMELAIIGSDIQEVIGSAIAIKLLSNGAVPIYAGVLLTGIDTFTFLFLENYGVRKLEAFFAALITTMSFTFGYLYVRTTTTADQGDIMKGLFVPDLDMHNAVVEQATGIIGAIIMPHNIYLHSALVLSREIQRSNRRKVREGNFYNAIESAVALFVSFIINLFVVCVFAKLFFFPKEHPVTDIQLVTAGERLKHLGWQHCKNSSAVLANSSIASPTEATWCSKPSNPYWIIWGVGILAAGQSSTMTGTYAGQFVMEGFLKVKWQRWKRVLVTRSIAMVPTIIVALAFTSQLDFLNEWLNVEQMLLLPFALMPILHFTNSQAVMGDFANGRIARVLVWVLGLIVFGTNLYLIFSQIVVVKTTWYWHMLGILFVIVYLIVVAYYSLGPPLVSRILTFLRRRSGYESVSG